MKRFFFLSFLFCLLIIAGCSTTRKATKSPAVLKDVPNASALFDLVKATDNQFLWYSANGNGNIDWEGQRMGAKVNVRIRKDSIIWVQITKLGLEVGRMLVTPDSAFFISRFEQKYARYGTSEFFDRFNLPADFNMFTKVFTGGAYIPPHITSMSVENDGALMLTSSSGVSARHWIDVSHRLIRSQVTDTNRHEWLSGYNNYQNVNTGQEFPYLRSNTIVIEGVSSLFDLDYTSIMVDVPLEFPFSIPSHYEKM